MSLFDRLKKKAGEIAQGIYRDVNLWDGGASHSNPNPQPRPQPAPQPAPQIKQNNPFQVQRQPNAFTANLTAPKTNLSQPNLTVPSYGSNPIKQAVNRTRDVFDANTPQDYARRSRPAPMGVPTQSYQEQQKTNPSNLTKLSKVVNGTARVVGAPVIANVDIARAGIGQVTGNQVARNNALKSATDNSLKIPRLGLDLAKGTVQGSVTIGKGLSQLSTDKQNAEKAQQNLIDQLNKQKLDLIKNVKTNGFTSQADYNRKMNYADNLWNNEAQARQTQISDQTQKYSDIDPVKQALAIADTGLTALSFGVAGATKQGAKAVAGETLEQQLQKGVGKEVATQLAKKAGGREILKQSALTGSMGGFQGAINPYIVKDKGTVTPTDVFGGALMGAALGGALPATFVGAGYAKDGLKNLNRVKLNQAGAVGKNILDDGGKVKGAPIEKTPTYYHGSTNDKLTNLETGAKLGLNEKRNLIYLSDTKNGATPYTKNRATDGTLTDSKTGKLYEVTVDGKVIDAIDAKDLQSLKTLNGYDGLSGLSKRHISNAESLGYLSADILEANPELVKYLSDNGINGVKTALPNSPGDKQVLVTNPQAAKIRNQPTGGAPIEKTANLSQVPKQPTISPNKTMQPQPQTKPLGVDGKIVSDLNNAQKQPLKQTSQPVLKSPYMNNTLRESTKLDQKNPVIKEYAKMLKEYDDGAVGGQIIGDYSSGYKRITEHSPFYSGYYKMYGRKPSMKAWAEEAERQLKSGKAYDEMQKAFNDYNDPEIKALLSRVPEKELTAVEQNKINADTLKKEVLDFRKGLTPVKQTRSDKNIPVFKLTKDSDVITKTNVNPNIKKGEKRFAIDANGELQPDTNGAYRLFTDEDGKVTSFRIGNKVYGAKDFGDLSQVNDYGSTIATMRRNIERAYKDNPTAKSKVQEFIVDHQQQQATKMIERQVAYRDAMKTIADDLGINFSKGTRKAKQVSAEIQNFGEGTIKKQDLVAKYGDDYANKIVNADKWFREQYDVVLNEMNNTLTKYGYNPIPKRSNYYTHFQDENVWKKFGIKMDEVRNLMNGQLQEANPNGVRGAIPSKLAGMSEYLLPNKKFNPYALERKGAKYTPDAFQAFEKYLNPALNNIYMTPSITRTRVLARAIAQNSDLAGTSPSKLIVQMREWANHLAGKTNRIGDRQAADSDWMSYALKLSESMQRKVGQQSIVGNVATAVMQPVVLAQTTAKAGFKNTLLALMQEFPGAPAHSSSAPIRLSSFMKRRYLDTTPVTAGKLDIASKAASTPLTVIEETAGRVTWNSYYNQALEQGLKGKKAINFADTWAEKTMAGRAIGEKPELYRSKSAAFATQFQLEVNNMWQQLGKEFTKKDVARFVVAAYGINMAMQQVTGRQPTFNPLDAAIDSVVEMANSEDSSAEKAKKIGQRWAGEMVMNTPIASQAVGLLMDDARVKKLFGPQTPAGRFGVGSTFRSFGDNTVGKMIDGKPLEAAAYFASPFGYSQAQKSIKGLKAVADGKLTNKDGNTTVEIPQTPKNWVKGGLFGPSAIPEVNAYYNNIGLNKKDQKPVPNQTSSVASRQGQTPLLTREDQLKDAKNSIKYGAGKEWAKLTETEIKQKALDGDEQAKVVYQGMQAMEKVYAPKNIPTKGLNSTAEDILNKDKKITSTGKNAWNSKPNTNQTVKDTLKAWNNGKDVPVTNEVAKQWAEYERDRVSNKISPTEINKKKKSILKTAYSSTLNDFEREYYDSPDDDILSALNSNKISEDSLRKALNVDAKLVADGIIRSSGFGKKVWNALGMSQPKGSSSGSRSSSKKSKGAKKAKLSKFVKAPPVSKVKLTTSKPSVKKISYKTSLKGIKPVKKLSQIK